MIMIEQLQRALNSIGETLVVDGIYGPKTKAALFKHPLVVKWTSTADSDHRKLAYILATAWHETAHTMQPVTEYGGEKYLRSKKYWPYVGRGYVQLTWRANYEKYGIADNPEKALEPEFAAAVMVDGMNKGAFTGRKLLDYFSDKKDDPVGARKIINGVDQAERIAGYHSQFLALVV